LVPLAGDVPGGFGSTDLTRETVRIGCRIDLASPLLFVWTTGDIFGTLLFVLDGGRLSGICWLVAEILGDCAARTLRTDLDFVGGGIRGAFSVDGGITELSSIGGGITEASSKDGGIGTGSQVRRRRCFSRMGERHSLEGTSTGALMLTSSSDGK